MGRQNLIRVIIIRVIIIRVIIIRVIIIRVIIIRVIIIRVIIIRVIINIQFAEYFPCTVFRNTANNSLRSIVVSQKRAEVIYWTLLLIYKSKLLVDRSAHFVFYKNTVFNCDFECIIINV